MTRKKKTAAPSAPDASPLRYSGALTTIELFALDGDGKRQRGQDGAQLPPELVVTLVPGRVYRDLPAGHPLIVNLRARRHLTPEPDAPQPEDPASAGSETDI